MELRIENLNIFGVYWKISFSGVKVHESQHKGKDCPKGGLGRFPDLKGVWQVKGGRGVEEGDFDTPINIFSNENNLKLLWKKMPPSYYKESKNMEASCVNNIHIGEEGLCCCHFSRFVCSFFWDKVKTICGTFCFLWVFFVFLEVSRQVNTACERLI